MTIAEILILSLALSVDAFSVAVIAGANGCSHRQVLRMAGTFGVMHFLMPSLGWFFALQLKDIIGAFDHWVAFILLAFVGGKMIWEAIQNPEDENIDLTKGLALLMLAFATSVDTLAVGISFTALNINVLWTVISISLTCFLATAVGMYLSHAILQNKVNIAKYANIFGGFILISIGVKILFEHGAF